jgi:hypothetical protein
VKVIEMPCIPFETAEESPAGSLKKRGTFHDDPSSKIIYNGFSQMTFS